MGRRFKLVGSSLCPSHPTLVFHLTRILSDVSIETRKFFSIESIAQEHFRRGLKNVTETLTSQSEYESFRYRRHSLSPVQSISTSPVYPVSADPSPPTPDLSESLGTWS